MYNENTGGHMLQIYSGIISRLICYVCR